jgi:hypothetical protein
VVQEEPALRAIVVDHVTEPGWTVRHRQPPADGWASIA